MFCRFCGKEVPADSLFCMFCGKNLGTMAQNESALSHGDSFSDIDGILKDAVADKRRAEAERRVTRDIIRGFVAVGKYKEAAELCDRIIVENAADATRAIGRVRIASQNYKSYESQFSYTDADGRYQVLHVKDSIEAALAILDGKPSGDNEFDAFLEGYKKLDEERRRATRAAMREYYERGEYYDALKYAVSLGEYLPDDFCEKFLKVCWAYGKLDDNFKKYFEKLTREGNKYAERIMLLMFSGEDALREAANSGDVTAMLRLGKDPYRSIVINPKQNVYWYNMAIEHGSIEACVPLANMYFCYGNQLSNDPYADGIKILEKCAEDGYVPAMLELGKVYYTPLKKSKDAVKWLTRVANSEGSKSERGEAMLFLGLTYLGLCSDKPNAKIWLERCVELGSKFTNQAQDYLANNMLY